MKNFMTEKACINVGIACAHWGKYKEKLPKAIYPPFSAHSVKFITLSPRGLRWPIGPRNNNCFHMFYHFLER